MAVTSAPDCVTVADQAWVIFWPAVYGKVSVHPVTATGPLVIVTVPVKPVLQSLVV